MRYNGKIEVIGKEGLHMRPSVLMMKAVKEVSDIYNAVVRIYHENTEIKGILNAMGLGLSKGHSLDIRVEGESIQEALSHFAQKLPDCLQYVPIDCQEPYTKVYGVSGRQDSS